MVKEVDPEQTKQIFSELLLALNQIIDRQGSVRSAEVFMAVHALHKYVVNDIAIKGHPNPPYEKVINTARLTWLVAMKELRDKGR